MNNMKYGILIKYLKLSLALILASSLIILFSGQVFACSCMVPLTVDKEYERYENIIIGQISSFTKYSKDEQGPGFLGIKEFSITVEKVFKGGLKERQELTFTQGGGADCIWTVDQDSIGKDILFYLNRAEMKDGYLAASTCSRSGDVSYRAADILYLDKREKVKGRSRLSGTVTQVISTSVNEVKAINVPVKDFKINITGEDKNYELKTDANGVFEIYDLPNGEYKINYGEVEGYKAHAASDVITLQKKGTHENFDIYFHIENRITGTVEDVIGQKLKDVKLTLLPIHGTKSRHFYASEFSDENGEFEFTRVPNGTYKLIINEDDETSANMPFHKFYYPNVIDEKDAAFFSIGAGTFFDALKIIPTKLEETITVSGKVVFNDDKIASHSNTGFLFAKFIYERNIGEGEEKYIKSDESVMINDDGTFRLKIIKGRKGIAVAETLIYSGSHENCSAIEKILKEQDTRISHIYSQEIKIDGNADISNVVLKLPIPFCKMNEDDDL